VTLLRSIYATPSIVLRESGSVGVALIMWALGAAVAACGTAVYVELGTVRLISLLYVIGFDKSLLGSSS